MFSLSFSVSQFFFFSSILLVLWKYAIKKRAGKLIKNLRFRLQTLVLFLFLLFPNIFIFSSLLTNFLQYSKPFLTEDDSGQQEEISKILEDLPKGLSLRRGGGKEGKIFSYLFFFFFFLIVEEYEENIRFYLFSERFYIAMAVVFFFVISWKLALLACLFFPSL